MLAVAASIHRTSIRGNGGESARAQPSDRARARTLLLRSCRLGLCRGSPSSGTALGEEDGLTERVRTLSDKSRGNIRVDLIRTVGIQRLWETRGGRYFNYRPPGRYSKHRPPWARRSRATAQRAGVLDDEQRRPASGRPPGCPAAAAGHPPSFPVRLRVEEPEPPTTRPQRRAPRLLPCIA